MVECGATQIGGVVRGNLGTEVRGGRGGVTNESSGCKQQPSSAKILPRPRDTTSTPRAACGALVRLREKWSIKSIYIARYISICIDYDAIGRKKTKLIQEKCKLIIDIAIIIVRT